VRRHRSVRYAWLALVLYLAACSAPAATSTPDMSQALAGQEPTASLTSITPDGDAVPGWNPLGEEQAFGVENLYDLVNGQAEAFFAYAFESVVVQDYQDGAGHGLRVEVWQLATPGDAFGLYSTNRGGMAVAVGNEGDSDPGRRLVYWQDRYVVRLFAPQDLPDSDLLSFARSVAGSLPSGGEPPALLDYLPQDGLVERATIYFHQEISIQDHLWLGGENLLDLGPQTDGILARYDFGDGMALLLLVQYADTKAAAAARDALLATEVSDLVLADGRENLLGAVFGQVDQARARDLLTDTLPGD
jgi:hypothetical protein